VSDVGLPINPELTNMTFMAGLSVSRPLGWLQPYTRLSGGLLRAKQRRLNVSDGAFEYDVANDEIKWASGFGLRLGGGLILRPNEEWAVMAEINHTRGRISETWLGYTTIRLTLAVAPWNFGASR
jgi:hypothetical protein